ncbi:MAG: ECF-type sigma factor [Planctomycetota bacterium]
MARDDAAASDWSARLYDELHRVAERQLRGERADHTLQPTALVHEAWLRLARLEDLEWKDEEQFLAAAAGTIRRVLIDHARAHRTAKRGGAWQRLTLSGLPGLEDEDHLDLVALDEALQRLAQLDETLHRLVELRFFGGLSIEQTARNLGLGVTTVKEKWAFAKAWLRREL